MIAWELKLFGILPLLVVTRTNYELVEEESPAFGGGFAHNFERDYEPLSPTAHHGWEWEDKKGRFGFG